MTPSGKELLSILLDLLADQNQIKIKYIVGEKNEKEI